MRYALCLILSLAWALWFGGLVTLFVLVGHLFVIDRPTAILAAPRMILHFERCELFIAAIALIASALWRLSEPRAILSLLFSFFAVAAVGVVICAAMITPKMERLRIAGQSSGPAFRQFHGNSMAAHTIEATALLMAGLILPVALMTAPREKVPEAAAPTTPPA